MDSVSVDNVPVCLNGVAIWFTVITKAPTGQN